MQPRVRNALILLLTLGLLVVFVRSVNVAEVWGETRRANPWLLLLALVSTGVTYVVRALRWQYLLAPIGPTHFSTAFRTTVIGFAATSLLPARAGEVLRPYLLARREGLNATAAFATIILERLLDLITVLLLFAWFVLVAAPGDVTGDPAQFARIKLFGLAAAGAALAGSAVFFVLAGHPERMGRLALSIERVLPARLAQIVARFVETFSQGLAVMRQPRRMLIALDALGAPLARDRVRYLADLAGISYYVPLPGFVPGDHRPRGWRGGADPGCGRRVPPRVSVCCRGTFRRAGRSGRWRGDRAPRHFVCPGDTAGDLLHGPRWRDACGGPAHGRGAANDVERPKEADGSNDAQRHREATRPKGAQLRAEPDASTPPVGRQAEGRAR